ncbi:unnamed protein product, partial [Ectocarpus fasciculatus]
VLDSPKIKIFEIYAEKGGAQDRRFLSSSRSGTVPREDRMRRIFAKRSRSHHPTTNVCLFPTSPCPPQPPLSGRRIHRKRLPEDNFTPTMATARREESDEEFNPFLSPEAPPLSNPVTAPALPPRSNGGGSGGAAAGPAAGAPSRRRGSSRASTGAAAGGNPFAPPETAAAAQGQPRNDRTPAARSTGTSPSPNARPAPSATTTSATTTCASSSSSRGGGSSSSSSRSGGNNSPPAGTQPRPSQSQATSRPPRGGSPPSRNANSGAPASSSSSAPSAPTAPTAAAAAAGSTHRRSGRSTGGSGRGSSGSSSRATTVSPSPAPTPPAQPAAAAASSTSPTTTVATTPAGTSATSSANASPNRRRGGSWNWGNLGRSLIGAVLGPGAIGGEDGGGGGDRALEAGARRGRFRELTPHEMHQTPEGKFSVSVWRKNKQDAEPVEVSVGVYDTAYEGQRAAESFSPPLWQEPGKDSRLVHFVG